MHPTGHRRRLGLIFLGLAELYLAAPHAQAALEENEVKAAVVYNLTLFTEWPPASLASGSFNLCVLTENEAMADALARLNGKTVKGARLLVWRRRGMHDLNTCQAVYLGDMSNPPREERLAQLAAQPVLSVADTGTPLPGAMISLGVAGERVYFDIDLSLAQHAGLRLDPKLLRLGRSVNR
jgi:hypothetical protein